AGGRARAQVRAERRWTAARQRYAWIAPTIRATMAQEAATRSTAREPLMNVEVIGEEMSRVQRVALLCCLMSGWACQGSVADEQDGAVEHDGAAVAANDAGVGGVSDAGRDALDAGRNPGDAGSTPSDASSGRDAQVGQAADAGARAPDGATTDSGAATAAEG